ncbi:MAG: orotidine-5'-phosphate decarboxylase [Candidatus Omnitrophota bacterium]
MSKHPFSERVIVALDVPGLKEADRLAGELQGLLGYFKIGSELFTAHGWEAVKQVQKKGGKVFLDLKFHDIPNTVSRTVQVVCRHEVDMFTIHTSGGLAMMQKVREAIDQTKGLKPKAVGVTVLTSISPQSFKEELGFAMPIADQVQSLCRLACQAGLSGIVCSPNEVAGLRTEFPSPFCFVTPGVRPSGASEDDQKRICTPAEAFRRGADFIVIGRPITAASDPTKAASDILKSLS